MEPSRNAIEFLIILMHFILFYFPLIVVISSVLFLLKKLYKIDINIKSWLLYIILPIFIIDIILVMSVHETILSIILGSTKQ